MSSNKIQVIETENSRRIEQIYEQNLELDDRVTRCYSTFKTNMCELAYRYEQAITKDKIYDIPIGLIFDQIIHKMHSKGFSKASIDYCYKIFEDPFLQKYRNRPYAPHQSNEQNAGNNKNALDETIVNNSIKSITSRMKDHLEQIQKDRELLKQYYNYDPSRHNPEDDHDKHDYRDVINDSSLLDVDNEEVDKSDVFGFTKKYTNVDHDNISADLPSLDGKIRVKDLSSEPIETAFSKAYKRNLDARLEFYNMILRNPIMDPATAERWAMSIDVNTNWIKSMTDDKCSHDTLQWLYIILERHSQSINSASSKSKVVGHITGKPRATTREQITGKEEIMLNTAIEICRNADSIDMLMSMYAKFILKPRIADFHNMRKDDLSESAFGKSSLM